MFQLFDHSYHIARRNHFLVMRIRKWLGHMWPNVVLLFFPEWGKVTQTDMYPNTRSMCLRSWKLSLHHVQKSGSVLHMIPNSCHCCVFVGAASSAISWPHVMFFVSHFFRWFHTLQLQPQWSWVRRLDPNSSPGQLRCQCHPKACLRSPDDVYVRRFSILLT